ncbi:MAG TPA: SIR2 family protein [Candidatus Faecousia faecigallinarum]|nr:SIR2 family protein [Candidatus Faecousia faecigallinarum]
MTFDQLMGKSYTGSDPVVNRIYQNNQRYFSEILNHLKRNAIVPLIGAGFSASAYPGWKKLFMDMAKPYPNCQPEVEDHLNQGRFEEAASVLREEMVEHDFLEELYRIFGEHTLPGAMDKLSAARKSLPNLFRSTVITTNFEGVIEEIYQNSLRVICPHTAYQRPETRRALQNGKPVLFKLHGDIEDRDNIVITEEGYDRFYGEGSTLVETLTSILSKNLILFLGCSLETDRVLKVLQRCGQHCTYYALLGLPEETKNDADPFSPRLCTPDGKEIEAYRTRRKFLSQHNINCIWYPYEQYEALDVLLQALCPPGGPSPAFPVPKALRTLIGRDSIIQTVYRKCTGGEPVFVTGPGGIGKTEVCHSVLRQMAQAGFSVIYVNLIGVTSALVFCETVADAAGSDRLSGEQAGDMAGYLAYLRKTLSAFDKPVLYCDNWEDLWQNLQEDEKLPLLTWLAGGIPALVSSRVFLTDYDVPLQCIEIPPLNHDTGEDRALFVQVYQNKKKSNKPLSFAGQSLPSYSGSWTATPSPLSWLLPRRP